MVRDSVVVKSLVALLLLVPALSGDGPRAAERPARSEQLAAPHRDDEESAVAGAMGVDSGSGPSAPTSQAIIVVSGPASEVVVGGKRGLGSADSRQPSDDELLGDTVDDLVDDEVEPLLGTLTDQAAANLAEVLKPIGLGPTGAAKSRPNLLVLVDGPPVVATDKLFDVTSPPFGAGPTAADPPNTSTATSVPDASSPPSSDPADTSEPATASAPSSASDLLESPPIAPPAVTSPDLTGWASVPIEW